MHVCINDKQFDSLFCDNINDKQFDSLFFKNCACVCVGGTNSVSTVIVLLLAVIVSKPWSAGVP